MGVCSGQAERLARMPVAPSASAAGRDQSVWVRPENTPPVDSASVTGITTVLRTFAVDMSTGAPKVVK